MSESPIQVIFNLLTQPRRLPAGIEMLVLDSFCHKTHHVFISNTRVGDKLISAYEFIALTCI